MKLRKMLLIFLAIVFAVKLALIIILKTYAHPVAWEFESIANNLLAGKGYVYTFLNTTYKSLNPPVYTFLCAAVYFLTHHNYFVVLSIQSFVTMVVAYLVFNIADAIFGEKVGFIAAICAALHPGYMYYDAFNLIPLSIDSLFITLAVFLFLRFKDAPSALNMMAVGAVIGLGALSRGIIGTLAPFFIIYFFLFKKAQALKEKLKVAIFLSLATFLVISPWLVRNYVAQKHFVFLITTTGENLWRGNNPYATGTSLTKEGKAIFAVTPSEFQQKVFALDELGQKRFFEKEAIRYIREDPARFVRSYLKKIYYFWWFSPQSGAIYPKEYLMTYRSLYSVLLAFSVLGMVLISLYGTRDAKESAWLILFVFMALFTTQSVFYVEGRHRWVAEPLLMIFFSCGVLESYKFLAKKGEA